MIAAAIAAVPAVPQSVAGAEAAALPPPVHMELPPAVVSAAMEALERRHPLLGHRLPEEEVAAVAESPAAPAEWAVAVPDKPTLPE